MITITRPCRCSRCRADIPPPPAGSCTTGYARDNRRRKVCYACCLKTDMAYMHKHGVISAYVGENKNEITNWPGGVLLRVTYSATRSHNLWACRQLLHVWAVDDKGRRWYGKGAGPGICITMRRLAR